MSDRRCEDCGALLAPELGWACPACLWGGGEEVTVPEHDLQFGGEIARGGMGIVYRARQRNPEREVAAKMLLPHLLEEEGLRERFANEARVAASLDHPGILPVYGVGESGGVPYFTMKLAEGGTLADRLRERGSLPAREAVALVAEAADAIHYAHSRGVLHRDLKPGNILFDGEGRVYVSDFGLAKVVGVPGSGSDLTRSLAILGTPQYLPPEIARGSLREASTGGDIYSLGAVLYELLSGRPPFEAETVPGLLRRIADEEVKPPGMLPADLRAILGKCLEKEAARRYATAGELAADLRAWLSGRPVAARSPVAAERAWRWARRNPMVATLAACLVLALALGLATEFRSKARLSASLAESLLAQAALVRRDAGGGARSQALDLVRQSVAGSPRPTPERAARLRGEASAALALPSLRNVGRWKVSGNWNLVSPAFTADLSRYAAPSEDGGFAVFDSASREPLAVFGSPEAPGATAGVFAFDPGGQRVSATYVNMTARRGVTEVYDTGGAAPRLLGRFDATGVKGAVPVLFGDGRFLVQGSGGFRIGRESEALASFALEVESARVVPSSATLSRDEKRIAAALEEPPGLAVWTLGSGGSRLDWRIALPGVPQCIAWSRDGGRLAFADRGDAPVSLVVVDGGNGDVLASLPGHGAAVTAIDFHPDGDSLASVGFDNWVVWQSTHSGGFRARLPGNPGPLVFTGDGKRLGYSPARGNLGIADVGLPVGWRHWPDTGGLGTLTCAESTPDGQRVATATLDGLALWDAESGRRLDFRPWLKTPVRWPWFRLSPDGRFLVCSDSDIPLTRWPVLAGGFGEAEEIAVLRGGTHIIHDFAADGKDWLVSSDREQREASGSANFYHWPDGDPARARLIAAGARANGFSFIPPGARLALSFHSHLADARLWDCETAREIRALGHGEPIFPGVSGDGTRVCTIGAVEGRLWNTSDWSQVAVWSQDERGRSVPVFSPDSGYFATTTPAGHVSIRQATDGAPYLELAPPRELTAPELRWLGNDRLLLASAVDGLCEWNLTVLKASAAREGIPW